MKLRLVPLMSCILIVGSTVLGFALLQRTQSSFKDLGESISATESRNDLMDVPVYPGDKNIRMRQDQDGSWTTTSFTVKGSVQDVAAYYDSELQKIGWKIVNEHKGYDGRTTQLRDFTWPGDPSETSFLYFLSVQVSKSGMTRNDAFTNVDFAVTKIPDADNLPLHPGAEQTLVEYSHDQDGHVTRTISYMVTAQPSDLQAFYETALLADGWKRSADENATVQEGLVFDFFKHGPMESIFWGEVKVSASSLPGDQLMVQLKVKRSGVSDKP